MERNQEGGLPWSLPSCTNVLRLERQGLVLGPEAPDVVNAQQLSICVFVCRRVFTYLYASFKCAHTLVVYPCAWACAMAIRNPRVFFDMVIGNQKGKSLQLKPRGMKFGQRL